MRFNWTCLVITRQVATSLDAASLLTIQAIYHDPKRAEWTTCEYIAYHILITWYASSSHMQIEKLCKLREIYYAPRMMKTNLLAEFLLYTNYEPYALSSGTFPVPPVGKELMMISYYPWICTTKKMKILRMTEWRGNAHDWKPSRWSEDLFADIISMSSTKVTTWSDCITSNTIK